MLCPHGKIHVEAALGGAMIDQAKLEVKQVTALGFLCSSEVMKVACFAIRFFESVSSHHSILATHYTPVLAM